jgi:capsular polysaccharide export protein
MIGFAPKGRGRLSRVQGGDAAPSSLRVLFPELADSDRPLGMIGDTRRAESLSRRGRRVLVLAPGLLQTPSFCIAPPWISGTVTASWCRGVAAPGLVEAALATDMPAALTAEARLLAGRMVAEESGGTAWAPPPDPRLLRPERVLVRMGRDSALADRMLDDALARGAAENLLLVADRLDTALGARAERLGCGVVVLPVDPWPLLEGAAALHAVGDDELTLLAALAGVRLFFPASPGDALIASRGEDEVAAAALLLGARYADPFTGQAIECATALDIAAEWRRVVVANREIGCCVGMSFWKRRRMREFFHSGQRSPPHRHKVAGAVRAARGQAIAVWSSRIPTGLEAAAAAAGSRLLRVEDGFVRSFGLGSNFLPPCSVIVDGSGIYYDPAKPSDLERLLSETTFPPALLHRACLLMARLVSEGVTKYGAGAAQIELEAPAGRRRVLVPGQVADDLSVRLGGAGVAGNDALLARVRAANPDAYIVYKPHPDVDAGHRPGALPDAQCLRYADAVIRGVPMAALIAAVDEVHTLTSLAGYEALLRNRRVVVHGQPFYAGWGLTEDLAPLPRRDRRLSLEELTAGLMLLYARYVDPVTGLPCPAEVLLDRLATPALWQAGLLVQLRQLQGWMMARRPRAV